MYDSLIDSSHSSWLIDRCHVDVFFTHSFSYMKVGIILELARRIFPEGSSMIRIRPKGGSMLVNLWKRRTRIRSIVVKPEGERMRHPGWFKRLRSIHRFTALNKFCPDFLVRWIKSSWGSSRTNTSFTLETLPHRVASFPFLSPSLCHFRWHFDQNIHIVFLIIWKSIR